MHWVLPLGAALKDGTVGVQATTPDYDVLVAMQRAGQIGSVRVYPLARFGDAIKDLSSGRVDAVMKVYPIAARFVRKMPGLRILTPVSNAPQPLGIGFNRNNPSLVAAVDHALTQRQQDRAIKLSHSAGA